MDLRIFEKTLITEALAPCTLEQVSSIPHLILPADGTSAGRLDRSEQYLENASHMTPPSTPATAITEIRCSHFQFVLIRLHSRLKPFPF